MRQDYMDIPVVKIETTFKCELSEVPPDLLNKVISSFKNNPESPSAVLPYRDNPLSEMKDRERQAFQPLTGFFNKIIEFGLKPTDPDRKLFCEHATRNVHPLASGIMLLDPTPISGYGSCKVSRTIAFKNSSGVCGLV
jgi:hypothetical protein